LEKNTYLKKHQFKKMGKIRRKKKPGIARQNRKEKFEKKAS
jgi:hypothetical protein